MYHNKQSIDYVKIVMLKKALQKMTLFFVIGENWLIFDFYSSHVANNSQHTDAESTTTILFPRVMVCEKPFYGPENG